MRMPVSFDFQEFSHGPLRHTLSDQCNCFHLRISQALKCAAVDATTTDRVDDNINVTLQARRRVDGCWWALIDARTPQNALQARCWVDGRWLMQGHLGRHLLERRPLELEMTCWLGIGWCDCWRPPGSTRGVGGAGDICWCRWRFCTSVSWCVHRCTCISWREHLGCRQARWDR